MEQLSKIDGPTVVTASWFSDLPPDIVRVSITRGTRRGQRGYRRLPLLAPGPWFRSVQEEEYIRRYTNQLEGLDPQQVYRRLSECAGGAPTVALLCFERAGTDDGWCHRALAGAWLSKALDMPVPEYGYAVLPQEQHPMLPPSLRLSKSD